MALSGNVWVSQHRRSDFLGITAPISGVGVLCSFLFRLMYLNYHVRFFEEDVPPAH